MRLRSRAWAWLLVVSAFRAAAGQVDVSKWPQVRVAVVATDAAGTPLTDVTASMLEVRENGRVVQVASVERVAEPMSVCLLLDSSGSMFESMGALQAAAEHLIKTLPAEDEACVADFSTSAYVDAELTTDRAKDLNALSYLKPSGGTSVRDALEGMAKYMAVHAHNRNRAIVLFSDGDDNASKISPKALAQEWTSMAMPAVHVIRIPAPAQGHGGSGDQRAAIALANMGGGVVYFPRNEAEAMAAVDGLVALLKSEWSVIFVSGDPSKDARERRLNMELDKVHQRAKAVIRAPQGYYAPSQ